MRKPVIDVTMLGSDIWGDAVGDEAEHDRVRAHRVVEYMRHRFPALRYNDDLEDVGHEVGRPLAGRGGKPEVV
jgi:hypothetical protein